MNKNKIKWFRQTVHLGDDWHDILIRRRKFRKNKLKTKIDEMDYDKKTAST